uniref:Integrase catalytic domain-containing protein n=1 Tax=Photinus pyralis TaxID=7054 RepID=A0A1Y1N2J6_PHOPY
MGKISPPSIGGSLFIMTLIDDYSHYIVAKCLKTKDEAFLEFVRFHKEAENQQKKLLTLQSDNGGEYISNVFEKYLHENGINDRRSAPGCPQQNGLAERQNRVLVEMARCMMLESGVPMNFWAEAIMTSVFIRNRCPSSAIDFKIPYEIWHNKKLKLETANLIKIFGCQAWAKKSKSTKFESKAETCVLIGFAENTKDGYRLWSLKRRKVIIRRDVIFQEEIFPFKQPVLKVPSECRNQTQTFKINNFDCNFLSELNENEGLFSEISTDKNYSIEIVPEGEMVAQNQDVLDGELEIQNQEAVIEEMIHNQGEEQTEIDNTDEGPVQLRKSSRAPVTRKLCKLPCCMSAQLYNHEEKIPSSYEEAVNSSNALAWEDAINKEFRNLNLQETWKIIKRQPCARVIGCKWVFSIKNGDGNIKKYKARLVAQGFRQTHGVNYFETMSPVVEKKSIRLLTYLAVHHGWRLDHVDVVGA